MSPDPLSALRKKTGDLRGLGDIRLVALEDGPGRGTRLIICRNAAGLEFEISVDRGFDLSALRWRGANLSWHSPVGDGVPAGALEAEDGLALLRSFDGFLVTCGLDHYGAPASGSADPYNYPLRTRMSHPLHGRISSTPATLRGYGLETGAAHPYFWAEADIRQAALYAEVLVLRRRIEAPLFEPLIRMRDTVANAGWRPSRHAMLYHFNVGYPLLDQQSVLTGSFSEAAKAAFQAAPPIPAEVIKELFEVETTAGDCEGWAHAGLSNPALNGGVALDIAYSAATLPGLGLWRAYQSGIYAVGLEPLTGIAPDDAGYQGPGTPNYLEAGASRDYAFEIRVQAP